MKKVATGKSQWWSAGKFNSEMLNLPEDVDFIPHAGSLHTAISTGNHSDIMLYKNTIIKPC